MQLSSRPESSESRQELRGRRYVRGSWEGGRKMEVTSFYCAGALEKL